MTWRSWLALVMAVIGMAVVPSGAWGIGANLARPANAAYGCEVLPTTDPFGRRAFLPSSFTQGILGVGQQITSCTYVAAGGLGGTQEVIQAPSPGIFTVARVKAGPVVGPMQVVVVRAIRGGTPNQPTPGDMSAGPGFACCIFRRASQVFTPAPNAVTAVVVNLPVNVTIATDPEVGEGYDYLGISVLAPGVPIPAHDIGTPGDVSQPGALAFFPRVGPERPERADGAGVGALQPLLNADFVPCRLAAAARRASAPARVAQGRSPCALVPGADVTGPRLSRLGLRGRRLRLSVSEGGTVTIVLARCPPRRRCAALRRLTARPRRAGTVTIAVPRGLSGRLRVTATATDAAGNTGRSLARTLTIPRR